MLNKLLGRNKSQELKREQTRWESFRSLLGVVLLAFIIRTYFYGLYQVPTPSMENTMLVGERFFADKLTVCFKGPKRGEIVTLNQPTYQYSENKLKNLWERYVWGPSNWTKRVIGAPGDELKGVMEDGRPVIYLKAAGQTEFVKLDEPYLNQYPVVATYQEDRMDHFTYRTYDPTKPLNEQPFYQFTELEIRQGRQMARLQQVSAMKSPGTPVIMPTYDGEKNYDEFQVQLGEGQYWLMGDNREASHDSRFWGPVDQQLIHGKIVFRIWSLDSDEGWWIFELLRHPIDFWKKVRWSRCFQRVH